MSLPSGVTTALVRFGPYVDDAGTPYDGSVTFQSSGRRVWEATGTVFLPRPVTVRLVDGAGSITLPVVDQDGWTDGVGNAVSHWTYTGTYLLESHARLPRTFMVLADGATGSIEVDLDLLVPVGSSSGVVVELPAVTSVNGMTGAVVIDVGNLAVPLVVNATDGDENAPTPIGAGDTGVSIISSFLGGEDEGQPGQFDSTGRLNLYSFQRADVRSYGENIRRFLMRDNAKSMDAWYMARESGLLTPGYDANGDPEPNARWVPVAWTGAHWKANDGLSIHGHWSVEVPDATGAVQTRFEVPFTNQEVADASKQLGVAVTNIRTNLADLTVRANLGSQGEGKLRIGGGNSVNKDVLLSASSDRADSGRRWAIRANNSTETGSNSGTDFQVLAYSDAGAELAARLHIARNTGNVGLGTTGVTSARLTASWATSGIHGFLARPAADPGAGAAYAAILPLATSRTEDSRVTGDGIARMVRYADGKIEWGDGTNPRDTNLFRDSANVLRTNDTLVVDGTLRHTGGALGFYNSAAVVRPTVSGSTGGNVALQSLLTALANLGLIINSTT